MKKTLKERFEAKLVPGENGCLERTGYCDRDGYGRIRVDGKTLKTHRVAWMLHSGDMPSLYVLHKCDNRRCCNPEHLFLGTHADNSADKVSKGRQDRSGNSGRSRRKVDSDMSHFMFILAVEGHTQKAIGKRLGVSQETVSRYLQGEVAK